MIDLKNPEIEFVFQAVRQAALLVRLVQAELVSTAIQKDDRSPVTVADFAAQALVGQMLTQVFPQDAMIGEEDSSILQTPAEAKTLALITSFVGRFAAGATPQAVCGWIDRGSAQQARRYWTLDPIDGTKGFLRGDQYAVALALVVDGELQVGALGCPNLVDGYRPEIGGPGSLLLAARG
ncbi:MAG: hypothetical protein JW862_16470, partial [Anaerolineales bacterium]|nr:hypothetical protein [Anaerolineales bacterium]